MTRSSMLAPALAFGLGACSPAMLAQRSSPAVGCEAADIAISEAHGTGAFSQGTSQTWVATCNGTRWFCSTMNETVVCSDLPEGLQLSE